MSDANEQAVQSGAQHVEESEHLEAGLTEPRDVAAEEMEPEKFGEEPALETHVAEMTLSMFVQGGSTRVRVGNAHNASELYEGIFETTDAANEAMLDAGLLTADQVKDVNEVAGTGIALEGVTVQQLEGAGLKRHGVQTG